MTPTAVDAGDGGQAADQASEGQGAAVAVLAGMGITALGAGWVLSRRRTGAHL